MAGIDQQDIEFWVEDEMERFPIVPGCLHHDEFLQRMFLPYDHLLAHGHVVRDRAVSIDGHSVGLASGMHLSPDIIVLATGSHYPSRQKSDQDNTADALDRYRSAHSNLE